jgi:hypothetical protein
VQRAKIRERVRRANEMEQEKERELQALGKGAEKVKVKEQIGVEQEGGCFGGMFGRMGIGIGKGRGKAWIEMGWEDIGDNVVCGESGWMMDIIGDVYNIVNGIRQRE